MPLLALDITLPNVSRVRKYIFIAIGLIIFLRLQPLSETHPLCQALSPLTWFPLSLFFSSCWQPLCTPTPEPATIFSLLFPPRAAPLSPAQPLSDFLGTLSPPHHIWRIIQTLPIDLANSGSQLQRLLAQIQLLDLPQKTKNEITAHANENLTQIRRQQLMLSGWETWFRFWLQDLVSKLRSLEQSLQDAKLAGESQWKSSWLFFYSEINYRLKDLNFSVRGVDTGFTDLKWLHRFENALRYDDIILLDPEISDFLGTQCKEGDWYTWIRNLKYCEGRRNMDTTLEDWKRSLNIYDVWSMAWGMRDIKTEVSKLKESAGRMETLLVGCTGKWVGVYQQVREAERAREDVERLLRLSIVDGDGRGGGGGANGWRSEMEWRQGLFF